MDRSEFVEYIIRTYKNSEEAKTEFGNENLDKNKVSNPSFLMTTKADNEEIYDYLKINPKASRFIFKKYRENQEFIKELCDPENSLYLKDVADNLSELYQISEIKDNLEQIRNDYNKYSIDIDRLKEEIKENEKEYDEVYDQLQKIKTELQDMSKKSANIRSDPGLEKINGLLYRIKLIIYTLENKAQQSQKEHPFNPDISIIISVDQKENLKTLSKEINDLKTYLSSNDFLSPDYLDEQRKKIKEQIDKEKEQIKKEVDIIKEMNPVNRLKKINEGLNLVLRQMDQGDEVIGGIVTFRKSGIGIIKNNVMEVQKQAENMEMQFRNNKEREKKTLFGKVQ